MKTKRIAIGAFALAIICLTSIIYFTCNYTKSGGVELYNEKIGEDFEYINFSLDELGTYEDVTFQFSKTGGVLFSSYGSMLVAEYNLDEFLKQKDVVDSLEYEAEPLLFDETKYTLPETEFQIGDWQFNVLCSKSVNYTAPKSIDIIGVNEKSNKIAYLTYYDQDIDYLCKINKSDGYMKKFVKKYFKYNFEKS